MLTMEFCVMDEVARAPSVAYSATPPSRREAKARHRVSSFDRGIFTLFCYVFKIKKVKSEREEVKVFLWKTTIFYHKYLA